MHITFYHLKDGPRIWWVARAGGLKLNGKVRESRKSLLHRWAALHGTPTGITVYRGTMRPAEAAMTIADDMKELTT